jgi:hypothetical protein
MEAANCDACSRRQHNLDPEGCWKMVSKTDKIGRFFVKVFGCDEYIYFDWGVVSG